MGYMSWFYVEARAFELLVAEGDLCFSWLKRR